MTELFRKGKLFIQMSGAPGSGKSTMATRLAASIGGVSIDHDDVRSRLLDDNVPFDEAAKYAYKLQWDLAQSNMKEGTSVIIDSPCNFPEIINQGRGLADRYGFTYWYVECRVDDIALLDERLRKRVSKKSQRGSVDSPPIGAKGARAGDDSQTLFKKWMESPCRPERNAIIVDGTRSLDTQHDYILGWIASSSGL